MKRYSSFLILVAALLTQPACASMSKDKISKKTNGEWTTLSGEVVAVAPDEFRLKTDSKTILIEMDDYDMDADGYKLVVGDDVIVTGRVDKDFFEKRKIEASSVYVKGIDTYFFANPDDEEDYSLTAYIAKVKPLKEGSYASLRGVVTDVDGREFTLDTGLREVTVETDGLFYNPLDNIGVTKIDEGDTVRASGIVDDDFLEGKELEAHYVYEIGS